MRSYKTVVQKTVIALILLSLVLSGMVLQQAAAQESDNGSSTTNTSQIDTEHVFTDSITLTDHLQYFMPLILDPRPPAVGVSAVYTASETGNPFAAFLPSTEIENNKLNFVVSGYNGLATPVPVSIRWTVQGPCEFSKTYQAEIEALSGNWLHPIQDDVPTCLGIYSAEMNMEYQGTIGTQNYINSTYFVVSTESALVHLTGPGEPSKHGFDRGRLPTLSQMQTWWTNSPYWVYNLYIGGISLYYKNEPLDAAWVYQAAQQGWSFILTWVGPQAPCSRFQHRMTPNANIAYLEGRSEAAAAVQAAEALGFLGEKSIYYDLESYSGATDSCRDIAKEFMRGWTEQLHELGVRSGGYGSACTSYINDWAAINPMPDDVWMAHWTANYYNDSRTVWDTACLSNTLWSERQRIKQYAGDHTETWGSIALTIDSNVIDARMTVLPVSNPTPAANLTAPYTLTVSDPQIETMDLLSADSGYLVVDNQLLWTTDAGQTWQPVELGFLEPVEILDVSFQDAHTGQVIVRTAPDSGVSPLQILNTIDGGRSWEHQTIPLSDPLLAYEITAAQLGSSDIGQEQISFELASSSAVSSEQLVVTQDNNRSWQTTHMTAAEVPVPDSLAFQVQEETAANLPEGTIAVDFFNAQQAWAQIQRGQCQGEKQPSTSNIASNFVCYQTSRLFMTSDGGHTWQDITPGQ